MCEKQELVTIDGPSGVGKSTVSKKVAAILGYTYLDTGAMYRGAGYFLKAEGVDLKNAEETRNALSRLELQLVLPGPDKDDVGVIVNGRDVSEEVRSPDMAMVASKVSAIPIVRQILTDLQKSYGKTGKIVAEGRDMGTVVFPQAAYKFFLDARPEVRAARRVRQLQLRGVEADYLEILEMTRLRDKNDSEREIAPLKCAADAIRVDTTEMTLEEVVAAIIGAVREKRVTG
jgi:cytidylate kinase